MLRPVLQAALSYSAASLLWGEMCQGPYYCYWKDRRLGVLFLGRSEDRGEQKSIVGYVSPLLLMIIVCVMELF